MTETLDPPTSTSIRSPWRNRVFRVAGLAAVVLGGWCLWLGFPATPKPLESEAFHDWHDEQTSPIMPRPLKASEIPPGRLAAHITDVSDSVEIDVYQDSHVVPANRVEQADEPHSAFAVANYAPDEQETPSRAAAPANKSPAGAWLTGTIEDNDAALSDAEISGLAQIPAWKRSSKPLSPRANPQRSR